jgi:hypothetical protein
MLITLPVIEERAFNGHTESVWPSTKLPNSNHYPISVINHRVIAHLSDSGTREDFAFNRKLTARRSNPTAPRPGTASDRSWGFHWGNSCQSRCWLTPGHVVSFGVPSSLNMPHSSLAQQQPMHELFPSSYQAVESRESNTALLINVRVLMTGPTWRCEEAAEVQNLPWTAASCEQARLLIHKDETH